MPSTVLECLQVLTMAWKAVRSFLGRNEGQDLSEWCLITALIALIALGIFWHVSGGMAALWSNSNTSIANAGAAAGATAGPGVTAGATSSSGADADTH
jgi:Flp pilus assembly pilin Flp